MAAGGLAGYVTGSTTPRTICAVRFPARIALRACAMGSVLILALRAAPGTPARLQRERLISNDPRCRGEVDRVIWAALFTISNVAFASKSKGKW
jgi:hypothetical protein